MTPDPQTSSDLPVTQIKEDKSRRSRFPGTEPSKSKFNCRLRFCLKQVETKLRLRNTIDPGSSEWKTHEESGAVRKRRQKENRGEDRSLFLSIQLLLSQSWLLASCVVWSWITQRKNSRAAVTWYSGSTRRETVWSLQKLCCYILTTFLPGIIWENTRLGSMLFK